MSATTYEKLEFVYAMAKHSSATLRDCEALMRYGATLNRLAVEQCNREWTDADDKKRARIRRKVADLLLTLDSVDHKKPIPVFSNDPRGCTLKIAVPDGYTNDWGKEGICVPTA